MIDIIQLGANIGKHECDLIWLQFEYLKRENISALFVEPFEKSFIRLKEYYSQYQNCFFERCAIVNEQIAKENEFVTLHYDSDCQHSNVRATTKQRANRYRKNNSKIDVPCMSLKSLFDKYNLQGKRFELLQLDIEGVESEVLTDINWNIYLPEFIRVETIHMGSKREKLNNHLRMYDYVEMAPSDDPYYEVHKKWGNENHTIIESIKHNSIWRKTKWQTQ